MTQLDLMIVRLVFTLFISPVKNNSVAALGLNCGARDL